MMRRMRTSNRGLKLLMSFEGFRSRAISLGGDRWVVGFGHTKSAREGAVVSRADAVAILQKFDLPPIEAFIADVVLTPLNQNEFDALVSLVFNIGREAFRTSDVLAYLNSGERLAAGEAFTAWRKARLNGRLIIVDALIRRRAAEKALFMRHPGGTPIAPSAHIRPILDEAAARFIPNESPIVATRERKPVADDQQGPASDEGTFDGETSDDGAPDEDDGQAELNFAGHAEHFVVPDSDLVPVSSIHEPPPFGEVEADETPAGAEQPSVESVSEKNAPEMAAGALVARLTRILGDSETDGAEHITGQTDDTAEDGPTPDEITRAVSELAEGASPVADDLPPLPETIIADDDALTLEDVAALEQPKVPVIDDLEPVEAALQRPQSVLGANMGQIDEPRGPAGISWLVYVALGLIGAVFAIFGIVGPSADFGGPNRGVGQYGYIGLTVLGGLLVLLALYFLFKAYRSRH